jgi:hypothetical protein
MGQKFNPLSGTFDIVLDKASEIKYDNTTSGLTATNTQDAVDELDGIIDALPDPIIYAGTWDASTNTPTLDNSDTGVTGYLYRVTVAGTADFGAGNITFAIGDSVVNNGTIWEKWDHSDQVLSVNTQTGAVVLDTDDISEGATNLYYTDSRAQGAITGAASTVVTSNLTADSALVSNPSGKIAVSSVTATELGYLSGVTSAVQTQLNDRATTELDNLGTTAINAPLLPASIGSTTIGSEALPFEVITTETGIVLQPPDDTNGVKGGITVNAEAPFGPAAKMEFVRTAGPGALHDIDFYSTDSHPTLFKQFSIAADGVVSVLRNILDMNSNLISNVTDPVSAQDAATKNYVDSVAVALNTAAVSSNITVAAQTISLVDTTAARSLTLPAVVDKRIVVIKDASGSANTNNITITPASGTIDGAATLTISSNWGSEYLVSNGTNWFRI